ncbi:MAG: hypothetical protein WCC36_02310 [Gammaproteobacteria bacterium]
MKGQWLLWPLLASIGLCTTSTAAGPSTGPDGRQPAHLFITYERDLAGSLARKDAGAVDNLLASTFHLQVTTLPGDAISRRRWMARSLAQQAQPFVIEHLQVRRAGRTATVSFLQVQDPVIAPHRLYIVDTWTQTEGPWKLSTRVARPDPAGCAR